MTDQLFVLREATMKKPLNKTPSTKGRQGDAKHEGTRAPSSSVRNAPSENDPPLIRLRAFRITMIRDDGSEWKFIIFEDVDQHRFRSSSSSGGGFPRKGLSATFDRLEAWDVLQHLREMALYPESAKSYWPADSLDALVLETAKGMWEGYDQSLIANPDWTRKVATGKRRARAKDPVIVARAIVLKGEDALLENDEENFEISNERLEAHEQKVWAYAGGKPWRWKLKKLKPAGGKCHVLTFADSEIVIPGPTSIEIPV